MRQNKSIIESLFNSLAMITCITILFIIFENITYRIPFNPGLPNRLSIFAMQFYASILQIVVLLLIFKFGLKREKGIVKEDENNFKTNIFDILIFLIIGLLLKNMLLLGLYYLQIITNTVPQFNNYIIEGLLEGMKVTNVDRIYNFLTGVILAPIAEELFFRKGVFEYYIDKDVTSRKVILISGLSFGLAHLMGFAITASVMLTGIVFATIYAITKNIMYPIIGHGLNNLTSSVTGIYSGIDVFEDTKAYLELDSTIGIKGAIVVCLALLVIISIISYTKRKTIISSDFKNRLIKVFTE